jgi:hypothetical protein
MDRLEDAGVRHPCELASVEKMCWLACRASGATNRQTGITDADGCHKHDVPSRVQNYLQPPPHIQENDVGEAPSSADFSLSGSF